MMLPLRHDFLYVCVNCSVCRTSQMGTKLGTGPEEGPLPRRRDTMTRKERISVFVAMGLGISIAILTLGVVSSNSKTTPQKPNLDESAVKFVQMLFLDDQLHAIQGDQSAIPKDVALGELGIQQTADAEILSRDYDANEVAADQKYKGGRILVTGRVSGISKDFLGDPYVSLKGHQLFADVQGHFDKGAETALANLEKGQTVSLVCKVSEMVTTEVMLSDCRTLDGYIASVRPDLDGHIREALEGRRQVSHFEAETIAFLYVVSKQLPRNSTCFETADQACETQFEALAKSLHQSDAKKLRNDVNAFAATLNVK